MKESKHLHHIRENLSNDITFGNLVERFQHSGFGLILFVINLPFLQPVPMAGLSTLLGGVSFMLGVQLFLGRKTVWLPKKIAARTIQASTGQALIKVAEKFYGLVEKFVKPRFSFFCKSHRMLGLFSAVMALMLMLPIPIPFSNLVCALPICLFALALLEFDGLMVLLGLIISVISFVYHGLIFFLGIEGAKSLLERF